MKYLKTPLKRISTDKGDIRHGLKRNDQGFQGFGEAYFTEVHFGVVKGWKMHTQMTLNLIVPVGEVRFYLQKEHGKVETELLGEENYQRLTVPPKYWVAFEGLSKGMNLIMNIADIEHGADQTLSRPFSHVE